MICNANENLLARNEMIFLKNNEFVISFDKYINLYSN